MIRWQECTPFHKPNERIFAIGCGANFDEYWEHIANLSRANASSASVGPSAVIVAAPAAGQETAAEITRIPIALNWGQ